MANGSTTRRRACGLACAFVAALVLPAAHAQSYAERGASFVGCWPVAVPDRGCGAGRPASYASGGHAATQRSPWSVPELPSSDAATRRASYPIETGWVRVVPTVVYVPDAGAQVPGVVTVGVERVAVGDPLKARAELGWSGKPGALLDLDYRIPERQASFRAEDRPAGAFALPTSRTPGSTWRGSWTERFGAGTTATLAVANDRLELDGREPEATSSRLSVRHRAADGFNLFASVLGTSYAETAGPELRRGVTSLGTEINAGAVGLAATYRDQSTGALPGSGHGGRVTVRVEQGGFHASLYADAQQQAATLEMDTAGQVQPSPQLAELGLIGAAPETVVPLFRDRGVLVAQHDVELGTLRVDPLRVQGGLDVKWRDVGPHGAEVGLRVAVDDLQGTDMPRRALLGQVQMSWRVFRETDLTASYASWTLQGDPADDDRTVVRLLVRSRL